MPKATLSFQLPEEKEEFETTLKASSYAMVLHEIDQHLRSKIKYAPDSQPEVVTEALEAVRDRLWTFIKDFNLDI